MALSSQHLQPRQHLCRTFTCGYSPFIVCEWREMAASQSVLSSKGLLIGWLWRSRKITCGDCNACSDLAPITQLHMWGFLELWLLKILVYIDDYSIFKRRRTNSGFWGKNRVRKTQAIRLWLSILNIDFSVTILGLKSHSLVNGRVLKHKVFGHSFIVNETLSIHWKWIFGI